MYLTVRTYGTISGYMKSTSKQTEVSSIIDVQRSFYKEGAVLLVHNISKPLVNYSRDVLLKDQVRLSVRCRLWYVRTVHTKSFVDERTRNKVPWSVR